MNYPLQDSHHSLGSNSKQNTRGFDMRNELNPKRLTEIMWDFAFLSRHVKGDSFEDYDKVLDEALERGYNTVRIDPLIQVIDLSNPKSHCTSSPLLNQPLNPWDKPQGFSGPAGMWLIEFMEKLRKRDMNYILSSWNKPINPGKPANNLSEITNLWLKQLNNWKETFGFEGCIYIDLSNEYPYFLENHLGQSIKEHGERWSPSWNQFIAHEVNSNLRRLRNAYPELLFTVSLHGDTRWIDLGLELDCMDIHFYADADQRFTDRTNFDVIAQDLFKNESLFSEFSQRCAKSHKAMAPMYRARQRSKLSQFASWSESAGIPLTTSESWASWFYIDHKYMDWGWLLDWAEWSVEDAIDFNMWGWTPHNYCQPQFENWKDVSWHRKLTDKFLNS